MIAIARSTKWIVASCCLLAAAVSGCACLPRIDPSGERIFIWPDQQRTVAPAVGNPFAAPVYTDPVFPAPVVPPAQAAQGANPAIVPPVVPPANGVAPETLSITPQRVLAPVGSEVILQAGICTDESYLLTDQKIEWLIARESAGELVSIGGRGWCRDPLLPWNKGKKIDNQFGVGYTAKVPLTITRGTPETNDDVQIEPGQAWASITSPVEGSSHVTAVAPVVVGWPQRRASATIYWVDVQWTFPALSISGGSSQVLTTNVRRQSDGSPLEGWIVRYQVADGGAALTGANSDLSTEVTTGIDGNASIDVTPTGGSGLNTQINIEVLRPPGLQGTDMPLLVVARGSTSIQWDGSSTYLPPADDLGPSTNTYPIPGTSTPSSPSTPITPAEPTRAGRPVLELEILGDETGSVGGKANYEIVITNRGDGTATGLEMIDQFQSGFSHDGDRDRTNRIIKSLPVSLVPGQSQRERVTFNIIEAGSVCHDVTVRCAEGSEASKRACMTVAEPAPQSQAGMEVNKDGVRQNTVGETTVFRMSVKNTGEVPLLNVQVIDEYDEAFRPRPRTSGYEPYRGNDSRTRFLWRIPRLEVGESKLFEVECECLAPKQRACSIAQVSADGGPGIGTVLTADDHCLEIVDQRGNPPGIGSGDVVPPAANGNDSGLRVAIYPFNKKPLAGSRATYQFFIENATASADAEVALRVIFPPEIVPDMTQVKAPVAAQMVGNELHFSPIATIRPGERINFTVTTTLARSGIVPIIAQAISRAHPEGVQKTEQVEIVGF